MIDLAAIRKEIASSAALPGWHTYDETEGSFELDAIVAGVPVEEITFDGSFSFAKVPLPVYLLATSADPAESERRLLEAAGVLTATLVAHRGPEVKSCRVAGLRVGLQVTVGHVTADAVIISLELLART